MSLILSTLQYIIVSTPLRGGNYIFAHVSLQFSIFLSTFGEQVYFYRLTRVAKITMHDQHCFQSRDKIICYDPVRRMQLIYRTQNSLWINFGLQYGNLRRTKPLTLEYPWVKMFVKIFIVKFNKVNKLWKSVYSVTFKQHDAAKYVNNFHYNKSYIDSTRDFGALHSQTGIRPISITRKIGVFCFVLFWIGVWAISAIVLSTREWKLSNNGSVVLFLWIIYFLFYSCWQLRWQPLHPVHGKPKVAMMPPAAKKLAQ